MNSNNNNSNINNNNNNKGSFIFKVNDFCYNNEQYSLEVTVGGTNNKSYKLCDKLIPCDSSISRHGIIQISNSKMSKHVQLPSYKKHRINSTTAITLNHNKLIIAVMGGMTNGDSLKSGEVYELNLEQLFNDETSKGSWRGIPPLMTGVHSCSSCFLNGYLYVIGGRHGPNSGGLILKSIYRIKLLEGNCIDIKSNKWELFSEMKWAAFYPTVTTYQNKYILILGGGQGSKNLNCFTILNTETSEMFHGPKLNIAREACQIEIVEDKLIVSGGYNEKHLVQRAEVLSTEESQWKYFSEENILIENNFVSYYYYASHSEQRISNWKLEQVKGIIKKETPKSVKVVGSNKITNNRKVFNTQRATTSQISFFNKRTPKNLVPVSMDVPPESKDGPHVSMDSVEELPLTKVPQITLSTEDSDDACEVQRKLNKKALSPKAKNYLDYCEKISSPRPKVFDADLSLIDETIEIRKQKYLDDLKKLESSSSDFKRPITPRGDLKVSMVAIVSTPSYEAPLDADEGITPISEDITPFDDYSSSDVIGATLSDSISSLTPRCILDVTLLPLENCNVTVYNTPMSQSPVTEHVNYYCNFLSENKNLELDNEAYSVDIEMIQNLNKSSDAIMGHVDLNYLTHLIEEKVSSKMAATIKEHGWRATNIYNNKGKKNVKKTSHDPFNFYL